MKHWKVGLLAFCVSGTLAAAPVRVVSSFSILGDVARQIGGNRVAVENLVGADQDAHAYHLTSADIRKISNAKLVLVNGLGLEKAELTRAVKQSKAVYAEAAAGISAMRMPEGGHHHAHGEGGQHHGHGEFDPHIWTDPVLMQRYAANVAAALIKADPEGRAYYQQRLAGYQAELKKLDAYAAAKFNSIAKPKRKVLTGHDAFAYMGKRYGIMFVAPQGVSSEAQPSAKQVAAIIRQTKREGVKAIFAENIKDARMVDRIAKETGVKPGGKLYSDALSKGAPADTYLNMYRYNVNVLSGAMK